MNAEYESWAETLDTLADPEEMEAILEVKPMSAPGMSCRSRKCLESRRATPLFLPNERFIAYKRLVVEPQLLR